jgi:tyrosinase
MYLLRLEEALQSVWGCEDVMLPYWDEAGDNSLKNGIPWALPQENFVLDGPELGQVSAQRLGS